MGDIERLYRAGWQVRAIATRANCDVRTVYRKLRQLRVPRRRPTASIPRAWSKAELALIRRHYATMDWDTLRLNLPERSIAAITLKAGEISLKRAIHFRQTTQRFRTLSQFEAGYITAMIDGEGSIRLERSRFAKESFLPRIFVFNTNRQMVQWLQLKTGIGTVTPRKPQKLWHRVLWVWRVARTDHVLALARALEAGFIVKKAQARLILNHKLPFRSAMHLKMKILNQRGQPESAFSRPPNEKLSYKRSRP